jgi:membrane associated rhomboid family serine protease
MLPLSDGLHPRRFPIVNVALIAANFAVWLLYELPHLERRRLPRLLLPRARRQRVPRTRAWAVSWFTAMFMHGS